jgi:hypothetical protein
MKRMDTWIICRTMVLMRRYIINIYLWVENDLFTEARCNHVLIINCYEESEIVVIKYTANIALHSGRCVVGNQ